MIIASLTIKDHRSQAVALLILNIILVLTLLTLLSYFSGSVEPNDLFYMFCAGAAVGLILLLISYKVHFSRKD